MSDAFSKIVAILLCVVMMYIIPVFYMREEADRFRQTYILENVTYFVDGVRNTGILSSDDYDRLKSQLSNIGQIYVIELEHCVYNTEGNSDEEYYFVSEYYTKQVLEELQRNDEYCLAKNDYLKLIVKDIDGNVIAWYGGSVKYEAY